MKNSRKTDTANRTSDIIQLVPVIRKLCCLCVFLSVSPFYSPLILKPDMIRNSFRSVFLKRLCVKKLEKTHGAIRVVALGSFSLGLELGTYRN